MKYHKEGLGRKMKITVKDESFDTIYVVNPWLLENGQIKLINIVKTLPF